MKNFIQQEICWLSWVALSLWSRRLNSVLGVLLTAFGVMLAVFVILFADHIQNRIQADGQGIDIVLGAKGSPLQLVLSTVYHVDIPTGNIRYDEAKRWATHPQIRTAIPLALGDNWRGFRIVGTNHDYVSHYGARLAEGTLWDHDFEAVAGAKTGLTVGQEIVGAHGLLGQGHSHDDSPYKIVGLLQKTGTVLDRLILTSVDSVLKIHGHHGLHDHDHNHDHHHNHSHDHHHHHYHSHSHNAKEAEITAFLLMTRSPIANMNLPRQINRDTNLQAANPAFEITRLTNMLGLGSQSFAVLSLILIVAAALSIFSGLAGALESRGADLAVLRALGYSRLRLFLLVITEGLFITVSGLLIGLGGGFYLFNLLGNMIQPLALSGMAAQFTPLLLYMVLAVLAAGLTASLVPAFKAAKISVAEQLTRR